MNRLKELFEDSNGKLSSKRVTGIGAFLVASAVLLWEVTKPHALDADLLQFYCISFAAVLSAGILEKKRD